MKWTVHLLDRVLLNRVLRDGLEVGVAGESDLALVERSREGVGLEHALGVEDVTCRADDPRLRLVQRGLHSPPQIYFASDSA